MLGVLILNLVNFSYAYYQLGFDIISNLNTIANLLKSYKSTKGGIIMNKKKKGVNGVSGVVITPSITYLIQFC